MHDADASLAIVNARVWTGDPRRPWADALLVRDGRLEIVGSSAEVKKRIAPAGRVIDAKGMMVTPPFVGGRPHTVDGRPAVSAVLRAGTPADLVLVDRDLTRAPDPSAARLLLVVEAGRVTHDPDGMLPA